MNRKPETPTSLNGAIIALGAFVATAIYAAPAAASSGPQLDANPLFLLVPLGMLGALIITELARQIRRRAPRTARVVSARWRPGNREG